VEHRRSPDVNPDLSCELSVSTQEIRLCLEILEGLRGDQEARLARQLQEAAAAIAAEEERLSKIEEPAPTFDGTLKCPRCGSTEVVWQEYVLHTRSVLGVEGGVVGVDFTSGETHHEATKEEGLSCAQCHHEFRLPVGLTTDHVDPSDWPPGGEA
jgi:transcription elongation factor Elf1